MIVLGVPKSAAFTTYIIVIEGVKSNHGYWTSVWKTSRSPPTPPPRIRLWGVLQPRREAVNEEDLFAANDFKRPLLVCNCQHASVCWTCERSITDLVLLSGNIYRNQELPVVWTVTPVTSFTGLNFRFISCERGQWNCG